MASTRAHMLTSIELLAMVIMRLALDAIAPKFWRDKPEDVAKLTARVWPLLETIINDLPGAFTEEMKSLNATVLALANGELGVLGSEIAKDWNALLQEILTAYRTDLAANKTTDPAKVDGVVSAALARSSFLGVGSKAVTVLFELFIPKSLNFMNWLGPTLAQLSGYEEIVATSRAPQYKHAFGNLAEYDAAQTFRTRAPESGEAHEMRSRRLISPEQYRKLIGWSGLMTEFEDAALAARYVPVSPRALATMFVDTIFPHDTIKEMMEFTGLRDSDIATLLTAMEWNSIRNVRGEYLGTLLTSAEAGVLTDTEVEAGLDELKFSDPAKHFAKLTISTRKLRQLEVLYRKSISDAYKFGQVSDAEYVPRLEAIGLARADAEAHFAIDSIAKHGRAAAIEIRLEEREAARLQGEAARAALAQYGAGTLDELALSAALSAAGLNPAMIAYAILIAQARRAGRLMLVYGRRLAPSDAEVLRREVAAIGEQTVRKLITPEQAIGQLAALDVPGSIRQALVAKWAAQGPKLLLQP